MMKQSKVIKKNNTKITDKKISIPIENTVINTNVLSSLTTKLSTRGYLVRKSDVDINILKELIVTPYIKNSMKKPKSYEVYFEDNDNYYLPREWGVEKFGQPKIIEYLPNKNINIKFNGKLRDYQEEIVVKMLDIYKPKNKYADYGGGIICIPPGRGKTVIAINIISKLQVKTIIVVNKDFLLNQWKERLQEYTPNVSIGVIKQKIFDVDNRDVVILMAQTGMKRDFTDEQLEKLSEFALVIFDEVHHFAAKEFSKVLKKFQGKYLLGLSATPEREDKLEKVFYWFLGDIKYRESINKDTETLIKIKQFTSEDEKFKNEYNKWNKELNIQGMITNLTQIQERNNVIVNIIIDLLDKEPERRILLLSHRLAHIHNLNDLLKQKNKQCGLYIGGMSKDDLKKSEDFNIILGTYDMASEGLDISSLDTLILATPKCGIIQTIGRILRKEKHMYKYKPLVIDVVDQLSVFFSMSYKRQAIYREHNYVIQNYDSKYNDIIQTNNNIQLSNNKKSLFIDDT